MRGIEIGGLESGELELGGLESGVLGLGQLGSRGWSWGVESGGLGSGRLELGGGVGVGGCSWFEISFKVL